MVRDAVERCLQRIGEAATSLEVRSTRVTPMPTGRALVGWVTSWDTSMMGLTINRYGTR